MKGSYSHFSDIKNKDGRLAMSVDFFDGWFPDKKLYNNGVRYLLYQGICEALNIKCKGIRIRHDISIKIFD